MPSTIEAASKIGADGSAEQQLGGGPAPVAPLSDFDFRAVHESVRALLDKQIFFAGGSPKSGTSWLQRLLDLHPDVSCAGEAHFLKSLLPGLKKALEEHNGVMLNEKENPFLHELGVEHPVFDFDDLQYVLSSAIATLLLKKSSGKPARAVGDRTASNVHDFFLLAALFPGAKCIQIVRDPRDAGVSRWFHARRTVAPAERHRMVTVTNFARQNAGYWTEVVGRGVSFGECHPDRYFELRYEDLVERTAPVLTGVFRFLGVDDSLAAAERCARAASFEKLSGGRARGQEDPDSFMRKGVAGDWRNHLDAETNDYVIEKAGALMRRFGYL
jgi:hypothetical protein